MILPRMIHTRRIETIRDLGDREGIRRFGLRTGASEWVARDTGDSCSHHQMMRQADYMGKRYDADLDRSKRTCCLLS